MRHLEVVTLFIVSVLVNMGFSATRLINFGCRSVSIKPDLAKEIDNLGISFKNRKTHRGRRGGLKVNSNPKPNRLVFHETECIESDGLFHIPVQISARYGNHARVVSRASHGVNSTNLVKPDIHFEPSPSSTIVLLNARSIKANTDSIFECIDCTKPEIIAITETWLKPDDDFFLKSITPTGFSSLRVDRTTSKGGGVGIICKSELKPKLKPSENYASFEHLWANVCCNNVTIRLVVLYRSPSQSFNDFMLDFTSLLEQLDSTESSFIIMGDFNVHVDCLSDTHAQRFAELLDSFALKQHVSMPTHVLGHTLDLIITRACDDAILGNPATCDLISDHFAIRCTLSIAKPSNPPITKVFRNLKDIDMDALRSDLMNSDLICKPHSDIEKLVDQYNCSLSKILNIHAPERTKTCQSSNRHKWYTPNIHKSRQIKRQLQRKWKKSRSEHDLHALISHRDALKALISDAKLKYYCGEFEKVRGDQSALYKKANKILHREKSNPMPHEPGPQKLCEDFNDFFFSKIERIREKFGDSEKCYEYDGNEITSKLTKFEEIDCSVVSKLIQKSNSKHSSLDPIPTTLVKACADILVPTITTIINKSLLCAHVPYAFKEAIVTPLLKKATLPTIPKNYRPVSNLSYLSKLLEDAALMQLNEHFIRNNLKESYQSAYRPLHSTETALIKVFNDVLSELDSQNVMCLVLLDLSAAFDTVDHEIILQRLNLSQGLDDDILSWIKSYLSDRTQRVSIKGHYSQPRHLLCGMPQGSKFGPRFYNKYTEPLGKLLIPLLYYHFYADDTQLLKSLNPRSATDIASGIQCLENAIKLVSDWMYQNKLQLNCDKTEFLIFGSKPNITKANIHSIKVCEDTIKTVKQARNLGVIMDDNLSMIPHINQVVKACRFHLRSIWQIRKYLSEDIAKIIVHSLVISKLDYCNSTLINLPDKAIRRLQLVMNEAARLVTLTPRRNHITPALKRLHWLPVKARIHYKVLVTTFKAINGLAPGYLSDMIQQYIPTKTLRSSDQSLLREPPYRQQYGSRAFKNAAPRLWNALPLCLRTAKNIDCFKKDLKTHLFNTFYN